MAKRYVAVSSESAKEIQKALDSLANQDPPREITGISMENGDLVIHHRPRQ